MLNRCNRQSTTVTDKYAAMSRAVILLNLNYFFQFLLLLKYVVM